MTRVGLWVIEGWIGMNRVCLRGESFQDGDLIKETDKETIRLPRVRSHRVSVTLILHI